MQPNQAEIDWEKEDPQGYAEYLAYMADGQPTETVGEAVAIIAGKPKAAESGPTVVKVFGCGHCHDGSKPIVIGGCNVWLAGSYKANGSVVAEMDILCPLNGELPDSLPFGSWAVVLGSALRDRGGVPSNWKAYINLVAEQLRAGKKVMAYCTGSHGRTGTFAASLLAVMEPEVEDPIAAIRERHCHKAVESKKQAVAIFALKGEGLPEQYEKEFSEAFTFTGFPGGTFDWSKVQEHGPTTNNPPNYASLPKFPQNQDIEDALYKAWQKQLIDGWSGHFEDQHSKAGEPARQQISIYPDWHDTQKDFKVDFTIEAVARAIAALQAAEAAIIEADNCGVVDFF